jgi:4-amino-4-deoxy-L-arabinose transferase-like glycosyltransferase
MVWRQKASVGAAAAIVCGLILRLVFLHFHPRWVGDTQIYGELAENMLTHHVFGFSQTLQPTLIRLPGFPIFLAACFLVFGHANYLAVALVQIALDLVSCVLLGMLAGRVWSQRVGKTALWVACLCPFTANYTAAILTETVSIFCVVLALFGLERWSSRWRVGDIGLGWCAVIGCALAFAVLVRPDQGLLAAAVVPAMLWVAISTRGRSFGVKLMPAAVASLIVVLPLLVWTGRNWRVFHVVQPLAPRYANDPDETVDLGFQRWYRTWGVDFESTYDAYWNYDGAPVLMSSLPERAFDSPEQKATTADLLARYNASLSETPQFDAEFEKLAKERITANPLRYYVTMPLAREADMWLRPRTELLRVPIDWWHFVRPGASVFAIGYMALNAALLAVALVGLWMARGLWRREPGLVVAAVLFVGLRCLLLATLDNSEPRYTLECYPLVILLAAVVLAGWREKAEAR